MPRKEYLQKERRVEAEESATKCQIFSKKDRRDSRPTLETYQNREFVAKSF